MLSIIIAIIYNNLNTISTKGFSHCWENLSDFSSFSASSASANNVTQVHCPFVNARYTIRRATLWLAHSLHSLLVQQRGGTFIPVERLCRSIVSRDFRNRDSRRKKIRKDIIHQNKKSVTRTHLIFFPEIFFLPVPFTKCKFKEECV